MNNNLLKFINSKIRKLVIKISSVQTQLYVIDDALYNKDFINKISFGEYIELIEIFNFKQNELKYLNNQYKNLNIIRLHVLG